jgi:hypothetical protein
VGEFLGADLALEIKGGAVFINHDLGACHGSDAMGATELK